MLELGCLLGINRQHFQLTQALPLTAWLHGLCLWHPGDWRSRHPWALEGNGRELHLWPIGAAWSCCQRAVLRRVQLAPARRCAKLSVEVWPCKLWKQKADSC
jgi:hypothetical protein